MTGVTIGPQDELLSIQRASEWMRARGLPGQSRVALALAIARGELPARQLTAKLWIVRAADLRAFGKRRARRQQKQTAKSA